MPGGDFGYLQAQRREDEIWNNHRERRVQAVEDTCVEQHRHYNSRRTCELQSKSSLKRPVTELDVLNVEDYRTDVSENEVIHDQQ